MFLRATGLMRAERRVRAQSGPHLLRDAAHRRSLRAARLGEEQSQDPVAVAAGAHSSCSSHWTPRQNALPGTSIASITPSGARAVTRTPRPSVAIDWWWYELTTVASPSAAASHEPGTIFDRALEEPAARRLVGEYDAEVLVGDDRLVVHRDEDTARGVAGGRAAGRRGGVPELPALVVLAGKLPVKSFER